MTRGTTIIARMPRITTTTRISISVKPRSARFASEHSGTADFEGTGHGELVRQRGMARIIAAMDSSLANRLAARDLAVVWHPCTQMHDHETLPMVPIARAEGAWLYGHDGKRYLDAVSSWWTCLLGHRHPRIVAALKDQLDRLDHVMLAGFTHEPAIELAEALVRIAPAPPNETARSAACSMPTTDRARSKSR